MGECDILSPFCLDSFSFVSTYLTACQLCQFQNPLAHALLYGKA